MLCARLYRVTRPGSMPMASLVASAKQFSKKSTHAYLG